MNTQHAYVVALTGGIASGKTRVSRLFEAHGVHVYDADVAAREVVEPGTDGLRRIVQQFGPVLDAEGRLDRPAMRRHVFADAQARLALEAIIHPLVRARLHAQAQADAGPYCLLAVPLLAENIDHYRWVDRVLLVDTREALQIARLTARDGIDEPLARSMLAQQATRAQRQAIADDVLDNSGDLAALEHAVELLHRRYLALAQART